MSGPREAMKILFFCDEYPPRPHGGIGTFVEALTRGLKGRGHEITVVGLGSSMAESERDGVRVITLARSNVRYVGNLISRIRLRVYLQDFVRTQKIDIVEVPDYMGMLPFGVPGATVVVRLHLSLTAIRQNANKPKSRGIAFYEKRSLTANPNWIPVSHSVLDLTKDIFGLRPRRVRVVYNPTPPILGGLPNLDGLPAKFILYAGQVSKRKGAIVLAEAARDLLGRYEDLHVVYAGGPYPESEGDQIRGQILSKVGPQFASRVHFLGHVTRDKVLAHMKKARVFVFPSSLEALPLVVLEAMNCGVPVVCTTIPPGPEMVEHEVNGLLADPRHPDDFRDKIVRILEEPELVARLTANARSILREKFSLDTCLRETEEFYKECLAQN
jgi:glycosyltransferase involved in cell wall biosynthesis